MNTGQQIVLFLALLLLVCVTLYPLWVIEYPSSRAMEDARMGSRGGVSASAVKSEAPTRLTKSVGRGLIFAPPEVNQAMRDRLGLVAHISQMSIRSDAPRTAVEIAAVAVAAAMLIGILAPARKRRQQLAKED